MEHPATIDVEIHVMRGKYRGETKQAIISSALTLTLTLS